VKILGWPKGAAQLALASATLAVALPGQACTPPPLSVEAGFARAHVQHLPRNAKGVVFLPLSGIPRASDFRLESVDDGRSVALRIRRIEDTPWVRIEPIGGFEPGVRYLFRYLPAHPRWRHADAQAVTIDDATVDSAGRYALALAPQTVNRVVTVPAGASCTKPIPVVLQEFAYAIPPALQRYQDALHYDVSFLGATTSTLARKDPMAIAWTSGDNPALLSWLSWNTPYPRKPRDAVIAPCANQWRRVPMRARISFPELDDRRHLTREVSMDLRRAAAGECGPLEAILQSMQAGSPDTVLRQACRLSLGFGVFGKPGRPADIPVEDFERSLEYPITEMTPTCEMIVLAQLWRGAARKPDQAFVNRVGAALQRGFAWVDGEKREQTVHALVYLLDQLPGRFHHGMARRLVRPMLPLLVDELAAARPRRPGELARLIAAAGPLPAPLRARLASVAAGASTAAPHARTILNHGASATLRWPP